MYTVSVLSDLAKHVEALVSYTYVNFDCFIPYVPSVIQ